MPKINVPQKDGEIIIRIGNAEPTTYKVTDHQVAVEAPDVDRFMIQIDGSTLTGGNPAASKKES